MSNLDFGENWFTYPNVYIGMVNNSRPNGILVELGAWKGRSSRFLVSKAREKSPDISIHIEDTWQGSPEHTEEAKKGIYEKFIENMKAFEGSYIAHKMTTNEAASLFEDGSLDGVFIDADHTYEAVKRDIQNWMPKVREGGILAGHDYVSTWPGVMRAVDELVSGFSISEQCWIKQC